jgi:hypothetical protein
VLKRRIVFAWDCADEIVHLCAFSCVVVRVWSLEISFDFRSEELQVVSLGRECYCCSERNSERDEASSESSTFFDRWHCFAFGCCLLWECIITSYRQNTRLVVNYFLNFVDVFLRDF